MVVGVNGGKCVIVGVNAHDMALDSLCIKLSSQPYKCSTIVIYHSKAVLTGILPTVRLLSRKLRS